MSYETMLENKEIEIKKLNKDKLENES